MIYSIDYFSFTIPTERPFTEGMFHEQQDDVIRIFSAIFDNAEIREYFSANWIHENALRFYQHRLRHDSTDVAISYGKTNPHVLVEFAGKACQNLDSRDVLLPLITRFASRCSRIDFAVDIECETSPGEFIASRNNKSFKSSGNKYSPTGGTEYIGGRTSERMARVYRYSKPHPRAKLLRVEAEYKGDAAKAAAEYTAAHGVQQGCLAAHVCYGWTHSDWSPDLADVAKITYRNYKPADASTVRWLYGDVVTALRKAIKKDLIDLQEWLDFLHKGLKDEN